MTTVGNVTVGTTTTSLGATDLNLASKVILCNNSDEIIYVGINGAAVMNKGIRLNANGDRVVLDAEANGVSRITAINAICTSGSKTLSYNLI